MSARLEAAVKAWDHYWGDRYGDESVEEMGEEVTVALAAADAVMFSEEAVERVDRAITAHEVITDGLEGPDGWCPTCGNTSDNDHQARAVIVALREPSDE